MVSTAASLDKLPPYEFYPYALYVEGTNYGKPYKRYRTIGHLKSAYTNMAWYTKRGREVKCYEFNFDKEEWEEISL